MRRPQWQKPSVESHKHRQRREVLNQTIRRDFCQNFSVRIKMRSHPWVPGTKCWSRFLNMNSQATSRSFQNYLESKQLSPKLKSILFILCDQNHNYNYFARTKTFHPDNFIRGLCTIFSGRSRCKKRCSCLLQSLIIKTSST
jgi:hypothetical protein